MISLRRLALSFCSVEYPEAFSLSYSNGEAIEESLSRRGRSSHDDVHEIVMFVGDRQHSVSAINIGLEEYTLDTPIVAFWSESSTYAEYLLASFETAWSKAVPAEERIEQLLKQR